jgi:hypothetical protein
MRVHGMAGDVCQALTGGVGAAVVSLAANAVVNKLPLPVN